MQATRKNWRLYDLQNDPGESQNLIAKHPEIAERLRAEFKQWFSEVTAGVQYQPIRIPIHAKEDEMTELSPSWARLARENIQYTFDGYDWDTIDSWKVEGESVTWKLNVQVPGRYLVKLCYGCSPQNAGGQLKIRVSDQNLTHQVEATATAEQFGEFTAGSVIFDQGDTELTAEVGSSHGQNELMRLNRILLQKLP